MAGYIGSKAVLLSTTAATVTGDAQIGGDLTVDTNTLFVDAANNRVGIGTSSPAAQLHVQNSSGNSVSILGQFGTGTRAEVIAASNEVVFKAYNGTNDVMTFYTGASERLRIDAAGRVTMPYQPMFSAFNLATASQYPINYSTWATFDSNLTNFASPRYAAETNIGSHYSTSNGRFTAPVAGRYLISLNVSMWVGNTSYITLFKNGTYSSPYQLAYNADLGAYQSMTLVRVMTLAAGDYVEPGFYASSGTYATFIPGGGYLQFSGYLIG